MTLTHLWDIFVQILVFVLTVVGAVAFVISLRTDEENFGGYATVFAVCTAIIVSLVVHV